MLSRTLTGAAVVMGILLTGCGTESGPTSETASEFAAVAADNSSGSHTRFVQQFTESLTNPCNGEVVDFVGEAINQINDVQGLHYEVQGNASGIGTGRVSGATYVYNVTGFESFNAPSDMAVQHTFGAGANARMITSTPGLSFTAHFQFRGVILPSGEPKINRSVDRVECKVESVT